MDMKQLDVALITSDDSLAERLEPLLKRFGYRVMRNPDNDKSSGGDMLLLLAPETETDIERYTERGSSPIVILEGDAPVPPDTPDIPGPSICRISRNADDETVILALQYAAHIHAVTLINNKLTEEVKTVSRLLEERNTGSAEKRNNIALIAEHATCIFFLINCDGVVTYVSPNSSTLTGYDPSELYADAFSIIHEDERDALHSRFMQSLHDNTGVSDYECRCRNKNGDTWFAACTWEPIQNESGTVTEFIFRISDITRLKQAQEKTAHSEAQYRALIEQMPGMIFISQDGRYIYCNTTAVKTLGYASGDEIIGISVFELIEKSYHEQVQKRMQYIAEGRANLPIELALIKKDGSRLHVISASVPIRYNSKSATLVITQDITALKQTEKKLRQSRRELYRAQSLASLGNYYWDIETGEAHWSEEMQKIFGNPDAPPTHDLAFSMIHPEDVDRVNTSGLNHRQRGGQFNENYRIVLPDGSIRHIMDQAEIECDDNGDPWRIFGTVIDITAMKETEQALRESEQKYRHFIEHFPDVISRFDTQCKYQYINPAITKYTGLKPSDFIDKRPSDLSKGRQRTNEIEKTVMDAVRSGEPHESVITIDLPHGVVAFDWRLFPQKDADGRVTDILSVARDISSQRAAERDLKTLFNQMLDGFAVHQIILDQDGNPADYRFLNANPSFEKLTGLKAKDIIGKTIREVLPGTEDYWIETYGKVALTGQAIRFENFASEIDKYYEVVAFSSQKLQFACIFQDITDRKKAELALRKREEQLTSIFRAAPIGIGVVTNRVFNMVNDTFCSMLGYRKDEMIGLSSRMIYPSDEEYDYVGRVKYGQIKDNDTGTVETRFIKKDGSIIQILLSSTPLDPHDLSKGVTFTALDITDWKNVEHEIEKSEALFRTLFETAPVGTALFDDEGHPFLTNSSFKNMLGYTDEELSGMTFIDFTHPEDMDKSLQLFKELLAGVRDHYGYEKRYLHKSGRIVWVSLSVAISKDEHGGTDNIICMVEDITERKQLENRLRQSQKMEAIGTLAGGIAHDFNNILSIISGYTELALESLPDDHQAFSDLGEIIHATGRARDLVAQILAISRQQKEERKPIMVDSILKEIHKFLRASLPTTIELRRTIESGAMSVMADPVQIHQVIMNLCTNASHAMRETGGTLDLILEYVTMDSETASLIPHLKAGAYVRLTVRDTGVGMTDEIRDRIFEPYYTTKDQGEGTGLGLAVVHGIVESLKGLITVESEEGKGTTFQCYFPAIEYSDDKASQQQKELHGGTEHVLLVDDEPLLVSTVERKLCHLGYRVTAMTDSTEALERFRQSPDEFDIRFSDITMPKMTGLDLASEVMAIRPELPVILCTGYHESMMTNRIEKQGIRKLLIKPLSQHELAQTIRDVLDGDDS